LLAPSAMASSSKTLCISTGLADWWSRVFKEPMTGNPPPRLFETAAGMLNAIGLQNIGAPAFLSEKLPGLRERKNVVVFANVFGYTRSDYEETIEILNQGEGIAAYEINVSCPNTAQGGIQFGSDPLLLD